MTNIIRRLLSLIKPPSWEPLKAQRLTTYFENNKFDFQFDYWEELGDGRGITAGIIGFTSEDDTDSDLRQVYHQYVYLSKSKIEWKEFIKEDKWKELSKEHNLRQAQLDIAKKEYQLPCEAALKRLGLTLPVAYPIIYDAGIQHGWGNDKDSVNELIRAAGRVENEVTWLARFLNLREAKLNNPNNKASKKVWKESVPRVHALRYLLRFDKKLTTDYEKYIEENF